MKEIGGYFELELDCGREYHKGALRLNLGRTAFEYILMAKGVHKIFLPYYICDVMMEPVRRIGIDFEFYHIDEKLEPAFDYSSLDQNEYFLYINYFGLKDKFICSLVNEVSNLIIDNSQSFFSKPVPGKDTFYSPRKFFGIPDGAYLYTDKKLDMDLVQDFSFSRMKHLVGRIETGAEKSYKLFKKDEALLTGQSIKKMSNLTYHMLDSINYKNVSKKRRENFNFIHGTLGGRNQLDFDLIPDTVPMIYPFLNPNGATLRERLINSRIFIASYWPNVLKTVPKDSFDYNLARNLIALPIDQRYTTRHMCRLTEIINNEK